MMTRKHSSRMCTVHLPTASTSATRCGGPQKASLNRSTMIGKFSIGDVGVQCLMLELGLGLGEPCTVRSNDSSVVVTWGPPSPMNRQTLVKTLSSATSLAGGNYCTRIHYY